MASKTNGLQSQRTKSEQSRSKEAVTIFERRAVPRDKLWLAVGALTIWVLLFAAGLLIETVEYRLTLAPRSVGKQLDLQESKPKIGQETGQIPAVGPSVAKEPPVNRVLYSAYSYLMAVVCFTPINLAMLALAAGLIGGCASNIAIETMPEVHQNSLANLHPNRVTALQEPPVSAAIRGFIVYLCVIAGLYVAMDDPFKDPTPGQYIRLAGTLSIMALIVGYDASRLQDWLSAIPGPGGRATDNSSRSSNGEATVPQKSVNRDTRHEVQQSDLDGVPLTEEEAATKEAAAG